MPVSLPLVAYLLIVSSSLHILAFLLYCQNQYSRELRFTAMVMFSLGAAALALASLLWMESRFAAQPSAQAPVSTYTENSTRVLAAEP
jgi:heme/copper-type cytochrome/quinol oxidase subunit 4